MVGPPLAIESLFYFSWKFQVEGIQKWGSSKGMFPVKGLGADVPGLGIYGRAHSGEALVMSKTWRYERDGGSAV